MFDKILIPTDGSQGVEKAIEYAVAIAEKFTSTVHILFVVESSNLLIGYDQDMASQTQVQSVVEGMYQVGEDAVAKIAKQLSERGIEEIITKVRDGHAAEVILEYIKEEGIDLIVMGTHGRRGLNRLLLGSVVGEVVHRATLPVMTVRMDNKD
ncbi:MAG TPA: universal stress protein [Candidatus Acetothermia bacterium]|nr:universal stress protein [Candidatus Acetothermia bacterium]